MQQFGARFFFFSAACRVVRIAQGGEAFKGVWRRIRWYLHVSGGWLEVTLVAVRQSARLRAVLSETCLSAGSTEGGARTPRAERTVDTVLFSVKAVPNQIRAVITAAPIRRKWCRNALKHKRLDYCSSVGFIGWFSCILWTSQLSSWVCRCFPHLSSFISSL